MSNTNWEADKMLDAYIHDYFVKRNLHATARAFQAETRVPTDPVAINAPGGFLTEWWSFFWDTYVARANKRQHELAASHLQGLDQQTTLPIVDPPLQYNSPVPSVGDMDALLMGLHQQTALPIVDPPLQYNSPVPSVGDMDALLMGLHQQTALPIVDPPLQYNSPVPSVGDMDVLLMGLHQQTALPIVDPPLQYNSPVPSVGDMDALLMGLHQQTALPIVDPPSQYNSPVPSVGDMDALLMQQLLISNQQQELCPQNSPIRQESMNQYDLMQQEKLVTSGYMAADMSYFNAMVGSDQAAEHEIGPTREQPLPVVSPTINLDTADTPGPSSSSVSTPPAHLLRHATPTPSMSSPAFSADAPDPLKLPTTELADRDRFPDDGSSKDSSGSPLPREDVITSSGVRLDDHGKGSKGFSVKEIYLLPPGQSKVECCDFSSGGKFLVTGGRDKKATLWSTRSFSMMSKMGEHSKRVTDVRFCPSLPRLATCSADKTVRIWNVIDLRCSLQTFTGHLSPVMSLDFHPHKGDLICSSDRDNEIRYWSINSGHCSGVLKGGANHMRFQPRVGRFLAAAAEDFVSLLDVETKVCRQKLQGHQSEIHKLCWDSTGELLASVSDDLVQVWAVGSDVKGQLVHEWHSSGKKFRSCVFHPRQPSVLMIGSYQTLELWDMKEDQKTSLLAHENLISCLAASNIDGFIASASYDKCVKIWN
ncbi:transcriptional corepressor LEUNIG-like [Punica granatum]|uniref:Transcriptional corepressor LEUNIG-like n=1 Tax=Punica granatum TaxID=22663 RepID=A0A6P8CVV9_PUNGR|nr:transcriptional corepressor LEUNIG-like [Punica granatum]